MSEPTLYRIEPDAATTGQQIRAVDDAIQDGVLVPVEEPVYRIEYHPTCTHYEDGNCRKRSGYYTCECGATSAWHKAVEIGGEYES